MFLQGLSFASLNIYLQYLLLLFFKPLMDFALRLFFSFFFSLEFSFVFLKFGKMVVLN